MKRALLAMSAAALLASVSSVDAQTMQTETSTIDFGVAGGLNFPLGDLSDFSKTGWHLMGIVGWQPATMQALGFRFDLSYFSFAGKEVNIPGKGEIEGPDSRIIAGIANVQLDLSGLAGSALRPMQATEEPGTVDVYATGGVGLYNFDADGADGSTDFGINVGAGVNFNLAGLATFVESRFHNIFGDGGSGRFIPVTVGVRFGGPR